MDYLPLLGSSGQIHFGTKRKFMFMGGSCCTWKNPISSQKLNPPHFDKKPRAEQADPQSWWEWHQKEAHGPVVVPCATQPCSLHRVIWTVDSARSRHFAVLTRANMRGGLLWDSIKTQVFSNQAGAKPISPSALILSFSQQLSL